MTHKQAALVAALAAIVNLPENERYEKYKTPPSYTTLTTLKNLKPVHKSEHRAILQQWAEALRSGVYPQTKGFLYYANPNNVRENPRTPVGFCCLGVYCNVIQHIPLAVLQGKGVPKDISWHNKVGEPEDITDIISENVMDMFVALNDCTDSETGEPVFNFTFIADVIEHFLLAPGSLFDLSDEDLAKKCEERSAGVAGDELLDAVAARLRKNAAH